MARTRCQLCGEWIGQRQEIVRVIAERVKKAKGDGQDPLRWSDTIEWEESFIAHASCTKDAIEYLDARPVIPCEGEMSGLFHEEIEPGTHLEVLPGGQP